MMTMIASTAALALFAASPAATPQPPASAAPAPANAVADTAASAPRIIMLRFFVADIARGETFYQQVLGMKTVQKMGESVRIMIFPGSSSPGIILIQSREEATMNGSFIIQVADLKATLDKAAAHGGTLKNTRFEQNMGAATGRSSHFLDPDGNEIEVLQMSPVGKR